MLYKNSSIKSDVNPFQVLYKNHEKNIISTRESLFSFINEKSPSMGNAAKKILERKLNQNSKDNSPFMYELYPWMINDFANLGWEKTHKISVNWLAINLYISILDDHLDSKVEIKAEEFIGASFLANNGLINLFKIVSGTKFENLFKESLFASANFQLEDVLSQAKIKNKKFDKANSASGKNLILIACAGALAASKEKESAFIIKLTKEILLAIQFLDDLADFEDDLKHNNITVLLNDVIKKNKMDSFHLKRFDLISEMISTGSLFSVIRKIESSLAASISIIESKEIKNKQNNYSFQFFTTLYLEVLTLKNLLENSNYNNLNKKNKIEIVEKVEYAIEKIYLHT